jgi:hypothetical protein
MAIKKAVSVESSISLPKIKKEQLKITLIGDTPLITHAWSVKAKKEMLDKQMGVPSAGREKKDPLRDFEQSMYRFSDGGYGFPSVAFKNAAVTACTSVPGITKVAARQCFRILSEEGWAIRAFDNQKQRDDLVRIEGCEPVIREDMVRVGMGTADLRYRAEFAKWNVSLVIEYNALLLTAPQIINLFELAGFGVGIGEWRMEKDGQFGCFHVARSKESKAA